MNISYDVGIIGGGLAGFSAAIQLAKANKSVILIDKRYFPYHKVCGEYISMESWNYLKSLGVDLESLELPKINQFSLSHYLGGKLEVGLPLGGFGLSRYTLDNTLLEKALEAGVVVLQGLKVENVSYDAEKDFHVLETKDGLFDCKLVLGAYGKRSSIDKKLNRDFVQKPKPAAENFVGIKYHIKSRFPENLIELHIFEGGYAGMSRIEEGKTCFCYLTTAEQLKKAGGKIEKLEKDILEKNKTLAARLQGAEQLYDEPQSISQIEFGDKESVVNHILMAGDAAGMITPLSGNGMSMALHAGKIAAEKMLLYLNGKVSKAEMEKSYAKDWEKHFGKRVRLSRKLQQLFYKPYRAKNVMKILKPFPFLTRALISQTHGREY